MAVCEIFNLLHFWSTEGAWSKWPNGKYAADQSLGYVRRREDMNEVGEVGQKIHRCASLT